jgi:hypothetical protein
MRCVDKLVTAENGLIIIGRNHCICMLSCFVQDPRYPFLFSLTSDHKNPKEHCIDRSNSFDGKSAQN